ncbi:hypothetical protein O181_054273 [Austropuccinia psidii MF-1]|uniref:Uncharacterized protein n=1 Tax=Austropuccinia psidii MF-1 TaxID=1389203 RepID=A0A9Q3E909_9BASI|nr:hypothetical protein [Austropuccinia psidii MF-1]
MLTRPHRPLAVTPTLPPISTLITPYAPVAPSTYTTYATLNPPYACIAPPDRPLMLPTPILMLLHPLASSLPQKLGNSTEFHEKRTSAPESGSEMSDMVSSHELGIEVESQSHDNNQDPPVLPESQPPSSQKHNFKRYQKEKTVEPCLPTEDSGKDDVIFSGEVEIISKEQSVSNISQTIPRLEKIQNESKIPDYVFQKITEAMSLLKMDLNHKSITLSIQ